MKKSILVLTGLFVAMLFAVNSVQAQSNTQTFNLSADVEKYIEVNPDFTDLDKSDFNFRTPVLNPGDEESAELQKPIPRWVATLEDAVYANCPFQISYNGYNQVGDGEAILARQEVNGNGPDRLQTDIFISTHINGGHGGGPGAEVGQTQFTSDPEGAATGTWTREGETVSMDNTPHDGEVKIGVWFGAALPHESPDFGADNTWDQSADAGEYTATLVATYSTL